MPSDDAPRAREEFAREDYHDPTAGLAGAPPARSGLTLAWSWPASAWVVCALGGATFVIIVYQPVITGLLAFFAAVAVVDISVVARRKLRGEPG